MYKASDQSLISQNPGSLNGPTLRLPSDHHREESDPRRSGEEPLQHEGESRGGEGGLGRQEAAGGKTRTRLPGPDTLV